jgi:hypothetical protein
MLLFQYIIIHLDDIAEEICIHYLQYFQFCYFPRLAICATNLSLDAEQWQWGATSSHPYGHRVNNQYSIVY